MENLSVRLLAWHLSRRRRRRLLALQQTTTQAQMGSLHRKISSRLRTPMMYLLARDQLLRGMTAIEIAEPSLWRNGGLKEDHLGILVGTMIRAEIETIEARGRAEMVEMTSRLRVTPPERTTGQLEGSSIPKKAVTGEEVMQGLDHLGMINNPRESMVEVKRLHHMAEDLDKAWAVEVVLELPVKASDLDVDHDLLEDGAERLR